MFRDDRMSPKRVALKSTIPSLVSGMFMVTRRCRSNEAKLTKLCGNVFPFGLKNQNFVTTYYCSSLEI